MPPTRLNLEAGSPSASKKWRQWLEAFESDVEKRDALLPKGRSVNRLTALCNCVSNEVYEYIEDCDTYKDAIETLNNLYAEPPNELLARHLLISAKQEQQTVNEFLLSLDKLAKNCNFQEVTSTQYQQEMVRDAFINGLSSSETRQRLLEHCDLNLETAVELAHELEAAQNDSELFSFPAGGKSKFSTESTCNDNEKVHDKNVSLLLLFINFLCRSIFICKYVKKLECVKSFRML